MASSSATALVAADLLDARLGYSLPLRNAFNILGDAREMNRCRYRVCAGVLYLGRVDTEESDLATEDGPLRAMLNMGKQPGQIALAEGLEVKTSTNTERQAVVDTIE